MPKELLLGKDGLDQAKEKLASLDGVSPAVKYFASRLADRLWPELLPSGFGMIARNILNLMWREGKIGPNGSLSVALLEHCIPDLARSSCSEEFAKGLFLYESNPQYRQGPWKGYACFNDDGQNALHNISRRSFEIATVRGIQITHYESKQYFDDDHKRCKELGFEADVLGQLEILSAKVPSDKFPISFVRAQDPRVQAVITAYRSRPFISLEELSNQ